MRSAKRRCAPMLLFLASDDARMCSGQEFTVDAGWV
jgi:NAD(P)-dependent dehydrogenase (short-subunit alcohol dehydrogenase family)